MKDIVPINSLPNQDKLEFENATKCNLLPKVLLDGKKLKTTFTLQEKGGLGQYIRFVISTIRTLISYQFFFTFWLVMVLPIYKKFCSQFASNICSDIIWSSCRETIYRNKERIREFSIQWDKKRNFLTVLLTKSKNSRLLHYLPNEKFTISLIMRMFLMGTMIEQSRFGTQSTIRCWGNIQIYTWKRMFSYCAMYLIISEDTRKQIWIVPLPFLHKSRFILGWNIEDYWSWTGTFGTH